jgi:hypothetical protein
MGIVAKHTVKKERVEPKKKDPTVINNFAEWQANRNKQQEVVIETAPVVQQEVVIETPVVEDTKIDYKRQPSSKWLSIKESDYVSHLIK